MTGSKGDCAPFIPLASPGQTETLLIIARSPQFPVREKSKKQGLYSLPSSDLLNGDESYVFWMDKKNPANLLGY